MENIKHLFEKYKNIRDIETRDKIFNYYFDIVETVCKFTIKNVNTFEFEEILQEGYIALTESIELFDESKCVNFEDFASLKIRNYILNYYNRRIINRGIVSKEKLKEYYKLTMSKKLQEINYIKEEDAKLTKKELNELNKLTNLINPIELDKLAFINNNNIKVSETIGNWDYDLELNLYLKDLKDILSNAEYIIVVLLIKDKTIDEISETLNITTRAIYYKIENLKIKIKKYIKGEEYGI